MLPEDPFVFEPPPIWIPKLVDQKVQLGKTIRYQPEIFVEPFDWEYTEKVHLNIVKLFGEYNKDTNEIIVDGGKMNKNDIGTFEVVFVGDFRKEGERIIRKHASLFITIYEEEN